MYIDTKSFLEMVFRFSEYPATTRDQEWANEILSSARIFTQEASDSFCSRLILVYYPGKLGSQCYYSSELDLVTRFDPEWQFNIRHWDFRDEILCQQNNKQESYGFTFDGGERFLISWKQKIFRFRGLHQRSFYNMFNHTARSVSLILGWNPCTLLGPTPVMLGWPQQPQNRATRRMLGIKRLQKY